MQEIEELKKLKESLKDNPKANEIISCKMIKLVMKYPDRAEEIKRVLE